MTSLSSKVYVWYGCGFSCGVHREGDLVLMDAGCEYHGYVSDVTRTWPVNGKFSSAQRDLYEVVRTTKQELTQVSGG